MPLTQRGMKFPCVVLLTSPVVNRCRMLLASRKCTLYRVQTWYLLNNSKETTHMSCFRSFSWPRYPLSLKGQRNKDQVISHKIIACWTVIKKFKDSSLCKKWMSQSMIKTSSIGVDPRLYSHEKKQNFCLPFKDVHNLSAQYSIN